VAKPYMGLRLPRKIDGAATVGELAERGCPKCSGRLYAHGSMCFGHLRCERHGIIWHWKPTFRERDGYAPTAWKNHVTGAMSKEWRKRWFRRE
jgi:hypothetical protein